LSDYKKPQNKEVYMSKADRYLNRVAKAAWHLGKRRKNQRKLYGKEIGRELAMIEGRDKYKKISDNTIQSLGEKGIHWDSEKQVVIFRDKNGRKKHSNVVVFYVINRHYEVDNG